MGLVVLVVLGAGLGWLLRVPLQQWLTSHESIMVGVTGGVLVAFIADIVQSGAQMGSLMMAGFGATISVLLRRLLMDNRS